MGISKARGPNPGLKKQAGSVLLAAGVTMGLVVAAAGSAYRNFVMTADSFRVARVKNLMSGVEAQARVLSQQPEAYVNCNSNSTSDCSLNTGFFAELNLRVIPGADCASGVGTCGITLTNLAYDPSGKIFSGLVSYQGREVTIKPLYISQAIPIEVLQMDNFHCGERDKTKPIFTGFNPTNGAPICVGFPACPSGYYAGNMAVSGHTLTCKPLPPPASCGSQSYFSSITWGGSGALNTSCVSTETPPFYGSASGTPPAAMVYVDRTPPVTVPAPPPPPPPPDPAPAPAPASGEPPCVVVNETSQGLKRPGGGNGVFYYNGSDAYCVFVSPQHLRNAWNIDSNDPSIQTVAALPTCKRDDGACYDPGPPASTSPPPSPPPPPSDPGCDMGTHTLYGLFRMDIKAWYYCTDPNEPVATAQGYYFDQTAFPVYNVDCPGKRIQLNDCFKNVRGIGIHYLGNNGCDVGGSSFGVVGWADLSSSPQSPRGLTRYYYGGAYGTHFSSPEPPNQPMSYEGGMGYIP